ncbi:MAG: ATP-binding protein [Anaerolineaceae bacterium]|nr:ATP-binding protein [Anaerolineaceae bacterium]
MPIEINRLKTVLIDSIENIQQIKIVRREIQLEAQVPYIFVGVRHCGKSFLIYQQMFDLVANGHSWEEFLYINFEDERLIGFDSSDFNTLLEAHYSLYQKKSILFLDEIQIIDGWEKFARRMADEKRIVYITGSNAKMLSSEMASTLGGRYLVVLVYTYSFGEYLRARDIDLDEKFLLSTSGKGKIINLFEDYFYYGGFPDLTQITLKRNYLNSIYNKIFLGDIVLRYGVINHKALKILMKKLAETVRNPISYSRLTNIVKSVGIGVGKNTIISYLQYAEESQLIFSVENYASTLVQRTTTPKYYFVDNGLLNLFLINSEAALLENLVAIALVKKYGRDQAVYYYEKNIEVDFYIPSASLAIQVCYSLKDPITYDREVNALYKLSNHLHCDKLMIITYDEEGVIREKGLELELVPVWKWLID